LKDYQLLLLVKSSLINNDYLLQDGRIKSKALNSDNYFCCSIKSLLEVARSYRITHITIKEEINMPEEKKSIFDKAFDAISSRDEKAALEDAQKQLQELQQQLAAAQEEAAKAKNAATQAQSSAHIQSEQATAQAQKALDAANKRAAEAEAKLREMQAQIQRTADAQEREEMRKDMAEARQAAAPKFIAEHTLAADETLSHLALKYYGHATPPYWQLIYEANKETIGDNPNRVRPGLLIKIPELPAELKDK
jgi:phage tail protein X